MNQLEYTPGQGGQSVQLDGPVAFVGTADNLRGRAWTYELGFRDLVSAARPAREIDLDFYTDYPTADEFRRVADADVYYKTPGIFTAHGEWMQRGYVLESLPNSIHFGRLSTSLKIALLDGAWWRLIDREFSPDNSDIQYNSDTGETVTCDDAANAPLHTLTVYGKAVQNGTPDPSAPAYIEVVESRNVHDATTYPITSGYIVASSGNKTSSSSGNCCTVDYVPCAHLAGSTLTLNSRPSGATSGLAFYDASKVYISGVANQSQTPGTPMTFTVPANAIYMRFTTYGNTDIMLNVGSTSLAYEPYGNIYIDVDGTKTAINIGGNVLASLPDGTQDVLAVDSDGSCTITKNVAHTMQATTDGVSATVGTDALSNTGYLSDGASVYYKAANPQTVSLISITMPSIYDNAQVSVTAEVTPTIKAEWQLVSGDFLDYPHDFPHDFSKPILNNYIESSVIVPSNVRIVVFGSVTNPTIKVGNNTYKVNVTVPSGGYLTIDGKEKTIVLTLADGTTQNAFKYGVRGTGEGGGSYIFEKLPAGEQLVTWDGSFGFNFGWYEEEGEPPWS